MDVKLHVDLDTLQLIQAPGQRSAVTSLYFKRGDAVRLQVTFLENGITPVTIGDPGTLEIQIGIKPRNQFDRSYLAHTADWSMPSVGDDTPAYECVLSFNTLEIDDVLNVGSVTELPEVTLMGEITWREGTSEPTSTRTFLVVVENDVNRGTEGTPLAGPTPADWLAAQLASGDQNGEIKLGGTGSVTLSGPSMVFDVAAFSYSDAALKAQRSALGLDAPGIHDIPHPWVIGHRGCYNVAPEETMEGYRISVDAGVRFIEPDCVLLADGTLGVMHDSTVDRTTSGTGNVNTFNAISWKNLNNDDGARLVGWGTNLRCPTFDEFLAEFGNKVVIVPECKTQGCAPALIAALQRHNIRKDMVIVQGSLLADCVAAVQAGYPAMRMSSTNYAETIAAGIEYTGFGWNESSKIIAATAAGLKVIVWTTRRNVESDAAIANGAIAFFSDDPVYQSNLHRTARDQYVTGMVYHGDLRDAPLTALNTVDVTNKALRIQAQTLSIAQIAQLAGWACPVPNPSNYTLDFSIQFNAPEVNNSRFATLCLKTTDNSNWDDAANAEKFMYNCIMRRDGRIGIYTYNGLAGGPSTVSSASVIPAELMTQDVWYPFRLTVTPTTVTLARLDAQATSVTHVDSTFRGAYIGLGAKGVDVRFKNLSIS